MKGYDFKEESLNHDNYEYDEAKEELIVDGERYRKRNFYTQKNGRKVWTFYSSKLKKKKEIPFHFQERLRMRNKMETEEGREIYRWRKITVEPVIGQMKENLGFRQFALRGLEGVKIELNIVGAVLNLKRIWKRLKERERIEKKEGIFEKNNCVRSVSFFKNRDYNEF